MVGIRRLFKNTLLENTRIKVVRIGGVGFLGLYSFRSHVAFYDRHYAKFLKTER